MDAVPQGHCIPCYQINSKIANTHPCPPTTTPINTCSRPASGSILLVRGFVEEDWVALFAEFWYAGKSQWQLRYRWFADREDDIIWRFAWTVRKPMNGCTFTCCWNFKAAWIISWRCGFWYWMTISFCGVGSFFGIIRCNTPSSILADILEIKVLSGRSKFATIVTTITFAAIDCSFSSSLSLQHWLQSEADYHELLFLHCLSWIQAG